MYAISYHTQYNPKFDEPSDGALTTQDADYKAIYIRINNTCHNT